MFERFTEGARNVCVLSEEEARDLKHNYLGTEHILLGLLREEGGLAARALESLDITFERVRAQVVQIVGSGEEVTSGQIPFTPRAKKVLELALREALSLGHDWIGTEHILLGLVRENEGVAARILSDFDVDGEKIRNEVIRMLSGPGGRQRSVVPRMDVKIGLELKPEGPESDWKFTSFPHAWATGVITGALLKGSSDEEDFIVQWDPLSPEVFVDLGNRRFRVIIEELQ